MCGLCPSGYIGDGYNCIGQFNILRELVVIDITQTAQHAGKCAQTRLAASYAVVKMGTVHNDAKWSVH